MLYQENFKNLYTNRMQYCTFDFDATINFEYFFACLKSILFFAFKLFRSIKVIVPANKRRGKRTVFCYVRKVIKKIAHFGD